MKQKHEFAPAVMDALAPLYQLTNRHGLLAVAADYGLMLAAIALSVWQPWCYPLGVLIIGSRQRALASILHESCHRTLTKNRALNNFLGKWLAGMPIFQSYDAYTKSHVVAHHLFLGDAQRDPDYINCIKTGLTGVRSSNDFRRHYVLKTILLGNVGNYFHYLAMHRLVHGRKELPGLVLVHLTLFALCYPLAGPWGYALFWLVPYLTSFQVIGWLSEISEHFRLYENRSPLYMSRNRFPAWWERVFIGMHGDNYHLTHHLFAGIPFWNLKQAHLILSADPHYFEINAKRGGIVSAPVGRVSSLQEIAADIDSHAKFIAALVEAPVLAGEPAPSHSPPRSQQDALAPECTVT